MQITELSIENIFFDLGLYKEIHIDYSEFQNGKQINLDTHYNTEYTVHTRKYSKDFSHLITFLTSDRNVMAYCPLCNEKTSLRILPVKLEHELLDQVLWGIHENNIDDDECYDRSDTEMFARIEMLLKEPFRDKFIQCNHDSSHIFKFSFLIKLDYGKGQSILKIVKTGQYPSLSDFVAYDFVKYKNILKKYDAFSDFVNGCHLNSHGNGIGSFTYMRRVFEKIVHYTYTKNSENLKLSEARFQRYPMDKKLKALKKYLPSFLFELKTLYPVLSAGIHKLSEDECRTMHPTIRQAILIILDKELSKVEEERIQNNTMRALSEHKAEISNRSKAQSI